jgi:hypothetical protein
MPDERSAGQTICEAIAFHRLLRLVTIDGDRIDLEPHCFGLGSDGRPLLLGWNVSPIKNRNTSPVAWTFCGLHQKRATHFRWIVQSTSSDVRVGKKANPKGVLRGLMETIIVRVHPIW